MNYASTKTASLAKASLLTLGGETKIPAGIAIEWNEVCAKEQTMTNHATLKLLTFTLIAVAMGWVIADAFDWRPLNAAPLPTIDELVATAASANSQLDIVERLRATPIRGEAAVDLMANCLMHESRELRQAARRSAGVTHIRPLLADALRSPLLDLIQKDAGSPRDLHFSAAPFAISLLLCKPSRAIPSLMEGSARG